MRHIAWMAVIFVLLGATAYRSGLFESPELGLKAGETISGKNKGYTLTIPDGGWLAMPEGRRAVDADLELSGRDGEAILVVFAMCTDGVSLDEIVAYRRSENAKRLSEMTVEEDRRLAPRRSLTISMARYAGMEMLGKSVVWVSAGVDGRLAVEVIVSVLGEDPDDELAARDLVGSLDIIGEDQGCPPGASTPPVPAN